MIFIRIDTGVHTGFAVWCSDGKYLAEVSTMTITQAMERIQMIADIRGNKHSDIRDVVRYVEWQNATGSLFNDDTATSCMSYYGLCE